MNSMATGGKNLRKPERGKKRKGAYEIRLVSPSAPNHEHPASYVSLAQRQRTPVSVLVVHPEQPAIKSRTARNYGGRSMRYRWADDLKPWQVHMLHEGDFRAAQLGLPLNVFATVNYHGTFPGGAAMASTFKRGMKRMGQWFRSKGVPFVFVYVHENPDDEKPNSHLLLHVPAHLIRAFKAKCPDWFDALDGGVKVDPRNDAQRRAKGLGTRLQYMSKGAPMLTCRRYGGHRARGGQGPIAIKRAGVAELLSKELFGVIKRAAA
jgi:hypothetical protein